MTPIAERLHAVGEATWPPASTLAMNGWMLRDGAGGGKRVSAATRTRADARPDTVEEVMRAAGERPLVMIREGEADLDRLLAARGYALVDPTVMRAGPIGLLTDRPIPPVTAFAIWEPLAIMQEIWAQGGIGPERRAVMARARIKTGILGRWNEKPAGVAFAAVHDGVCMVHAVEVLPHQRRQGMAGWLMRRAAFWGAENGADTLAVLVTKANAPANGLYASLGLDPVGEYHYRRLED